MKDDPGESYKLQAYQEGNPCVNFTRDELCCAPPPPKPASSTRAKTLGAAEYADAGDEEENIDTEPTEDDPTDGIHSPGPNTEPVMRLEDGWAV